MTEAEGAAEPRPDAESLTDPRIREVLQSYAAMVGGSVSLPEDDLLEVRLPAQAAEWFRGPRDPREGALTLRVALTIEAHQLHPDAQLAVLGSRFFQQLVEAVRTSGHRLWFGILPTSVPRPDGSPELGLPLANGTLQGSESNVALHPVGRLLAKVMLRAGGSVEERIVESGLFELVTGRPLSDDLAALCTERTANDRLEESAEYSRRAPLPVGDLIPRMLADLEGRLSGDLERWNARTEATLNEELSRIDRYYQEILEDPDASEADSPARRATIEREHQRRRTEEALRHTLRATVHPLQLVEWGLLVEEARWRLEGFGGETLELTGRRLLSGDTTWEIACPSCGADPDTIVICRDRHLACDECSYHCSVCHVEFCATHGTPSCAVDGMPSCASHSTTCQVCRKQHCTEHEARCDETGHKTCTSCLEACARCGRVVCQTHGQRTAEEVPLGSRWLCAACTVYCEGGSNEPVGVDEVVACASCNRSVCGLHQERCDVDRLIHCSSHLRRSDHTRRLICETHQAKCAEESGAIIASDEVGACTTCGAEVCDRHSGRCAGDGERHCAKHLKPLLDTPGDLGCERHRSVCQVDGATYTMAGTSPCPVCGKATCAGHLNPCAQCGRRVCVTDREAPTRICATCRLLRPNSDSEERLIMAAIEANGGEPPKANEWFTARDQGHDVVRLDLGWTRELVFSVPAGDSRPATVIRKSLFGTKRVR